MRIDDVCEVKEDNKQLQSVDKAEISLRLTCYVPINCKQGIHKKEKDEER